MTASNWCRRCGHNESLHREPDPACTGLALVGPGNEYDGGDYAPCRCRGFVPYPADASAGGVRVENEAGDDQQ